MCGGQKKSRCLSGFFFCQRGTTQKELERESERARKENISQSGSSCLHIMHLQCYCWQEHNPDEGFKRAASEHLQHQHAGSDDWADERGGGLRIGRSHEGR